MEAAVDIILALSALSRAAVNLRIDMNQYRAFQAQADAEGRHLTDDEINELAMTAEGAQRELYAAIAAKEQNQLP